MSTGRVFDLRRYSLHDGPGIRTTVFLQGCPLACWWCHNPESHPRDGFVHYERRRCLKCQACVATCDVRALKLTHRGIERDDERCHQCGECAEVCPSEAREVVGRTVSVPDLVALIERDRLFFDESGGGVTFSGGEPLLQAEFLHAALRACGEREVHRVVDTSGLARPDVLLRVAAETDLFLYDLKVMDPARHRETTGVPNDLILANLRALDENGSRVRVRIPLIPGISDDDDNIERTAAFLDTLPGIRDVSVLPYHPSARDKHAKFGMPWHMDGAAEIPADRVQAIAALLESHDLTVDIGG